MTVVRTQYLVDWLAMRKEIHVNASFDSLYSNTVFTRAWLERDHGDAGGRYDG
jgi:hypothetical protein